MFNLADALSQVLNEARAVGDAVCGCVRLYNPRWRSLEVVTQQGFDPIFLQFFRRVQPEDASACARAFRFAKRVIIFDVMQDPLLLPYLSLLRQTGFRGMQATPIVDKQRQVLGVLSTHFAAPCRLSRAQTLALDKFAFQAARFIQVGWVYQIFG